MFRRLLSLEWKSFFRSASFGKSLGVKIFMGFMAVYFLLSFIGLGFGLYFLMEELNPQGEPILLVNDFLLFWFLGEFILRFLMQNLPVTEIKPLLTKRISRNSIVHFLMAKSSYSFFNVLTPAAAIPFIIVCLSKTDYSAASLIAWLIAVIAMIYSINYLNIWIQKRYSSNLKAIIPFIVVCIALVALEYFKIFSISNLFGHLFDFILVYPALAIIPIGLAVFSYLLTFKSIKDNLYLDALLEAKESKVQTTDLSWTSRFGDLSPFLQLDLKLIWRNKRTKNAVLLCLAFLAYGLFFYFTPKYNGTGMLVLVGIFITGIFIINFGQYIPAWDSSYFAFFKTRPISMVRYLQSKALLMYLSVVVLTILSTFYVYFGWDKLYVNVACAIYNMGVNVPIILLFGAYNRKRIDLSEGNMMNYQGMGIAQWLVGIPLIGLPMIIWYAMKFIFDQGTANLVLIGIGVIGLLLHQVIIKGLAELYNEKHYAMLEGFKQKG